uniref:Rhodopsin n=1 Tax=Ascaris lumbricoides TaxID=6252 RepID=A0A0M3IQ69_ASCLU
MLKIRAKMSQPYGYAGQPPYQQQAGYYPQGSNPYQSGPQPPPPAGWAPQGGQPGKMICFLWQQLLG